MKKLILFTLLFSSCASMYTPHYPSPANEYETLGYRVYQYGQGNSSTFRIFDQVGNEVASGDAIGFLRWKQGVILRRIENPQTTHGEIESLKLQYQEIDQNLRTYATFQEIQSQQTIQNAWQNPPKIESFSSSRNRFKS